MKIKSDLRAGMTFAECNIARNAMKQAAQSGNCAALSWSSQPTNPTQLPSQPPVYYPPVSNLPSQPVAGGGYYGNAYYPDRSGACG